MTTETNTVHVNLSQRSYDIQVGSGNLNAAGAFIAACTKLSHAVVITDTHVHEPYGLAVVESLSTAGADVDLLIVEPGETTKSVETANQLWQDMLSLQADRKSVVVAVGGGVTGDLAGFVAATFARGIAFIQIPTTLLAQVDSSVGGKVGVNLPESKNMVGAFWQPRGVLIDTDALSTLPDRQYRAGLAEVVKYGVILDADFFTYLEDNIEAIHQRQSDVLRHIVTCCCQLKADVVEQDEREETGQRAVLNYGHTFCHAIETVAGYGKILHGEAVSIGMLCASRLAEALGRIDHQLTQRQHHLLEALHLPVDLAGIDLSGIDHDALLAAMQRDKKVEHGRLRFVLPSRMGHVELVADVQPQQAKAALTA